MPRRRQYGSLHLIGSGNVYGFGEHLMIDMEWEVRERKVMRITLRFLVCINRVESDTLKWDVIF